MKRRGFITALGLAPVAATTKPTKQPRLESGRALVEYHKGSALGAPVTKIKTVTEMYCAGLITKDQANQLLDFPSYEDMARWRRG